MKHACSLVRFPTKCCIPNTSKLRRHRSTLVLDASPISSEALDHARPFEEIPGPRPLPLIGNVHRYMPGIGEYSKSKWHETQRMKFRQYGSIVREELTPQIKMVHLFEPNDMEVVSRHEGKHPRRDFFLAMKALREQNPHIYSTVGVAAGNGEDWYKIRSKSQKALMRPQIMKLFLPQMNVIADDVLRRIRLLRGDDHQVPDLIQEFFKWALESVTFILFNKRMGCLADSINEDSMAHKYIVAVNDFFRSMGRVELGSFPVWRLFPLLSPSFRQFKKSHDFFFLNAMKYVKNNLEEMKKRDLDEIDEDDMSLIQMLLRSCSPEDASVMAVDAMAAGIDTTSLTISYVIRNLAENPHVQKKLQEEVDRVLPDKTPLTVKALDKMHYMKACVKESMRLCPTVQGTSRTLDKDIVLSGYRVPAETPLTLNYYVSGRLESHFPKASEYVPERWLKDKSSSIAATGSFAFQPFGFGPRMCIGRRIAELEMFTLLSKLMQNFWIENHCRDLDIQFQLVLMVKSPLKFEFYERH